RCQCNCLPGSSDIKVQPPLEIFLSVQLSMEPPTATTESYNSLALFVQSRSHLGAAFHLFIHKVVVALAGATLSKVFVACGNNIERIKLNRDVERVGPADGRSQNDLQNSFPAVYFEIW